MTRRSLGEVEGVEYARDFVEGAENVAGVFFAVDVDGGDGLQVAGEVIGEGGAIREEALEGFPDVAEEEAAALGFAVEGEEEAHFELVEVLELAGGDGGGEGLGGFGAGAGPVAHGDAAFGAEDAAEFAGEGGEGGVFDEEGEANVGDDEVEGGVGEGKVAPVAEEGAAVRGVAGPNGADHVGTGVDGVEAHLRSPGKEGVFGGDAEGEDFDGAIGEGGGEGGEPGLLDALAILGPRS